mmetsp:Transcript_116062/g.231376  ORF Transcript_116062/g.231376 Transcript_116062/m.231376 type:complete len:110 (-) Transcript_116062:69-398(-)
MKMSNGIKPSGWIGYCGQNSLRNLAWARVESAETKELSRVAHKKMTMILTTMTMQKGSANEYGRTALLHLDNEGPAHAWSCNFLVPIVAAQLKLHSSGTRGLLFSWTVG